MDSRIATGKTLEIRIPYRNPQGFLITTTPKSLFVQEIDTFLILHGEDILRRHRRAFEVYPPFYGSIVTSSNILPNPPAYNTHVG